MHISCPVPLTQLISCSLPFWLHCVGSHSLSNAVTQPYRKYSNTWWLLTKGSELVMGYVCQVFIHWGKTLLKLQRFQHKYYYLDNVFINVKKWDPGLIKLKTKQAVKGIQTALPCFTQISFRSVFVQLYLVVTVQNEM